MANNPKFNFYVNDFEGGTRHMTDAELGCYVRLLLAQFNRGGTLKNDKKFLARFCTSLNESWDIVSEKFIEVTSGEIQNIRMEVERQKSESFSKSRAENRRKKEEESETQEEDMLYTTNTNEQTSEEVVGNGNGLGNGIGKGKGNKGGAGGKKHSVSMPFNGTFQGVWDEWLIYKKQQHNFSYKTGGSEQAALHELVSLAYGKEENAIAIIQQSMANGWKGLFALKNNSNGQQGKQPTGAGVDTLSALEKIDRMYNKNGNR